MPGNDTLQILIQGGAVGILIFFGVGAYSLAKQIITLLGNHLIHKMDEVKEEIKDGMNRVANALEKREGR